MAEELGLGLQVGRLLCFEWQGPEPGRTESLMFVYDGGVLPGAAAIRLAADELVSFRFVGAEDLDGLMSERLARRVRAALSAIESDTMVELEHGVQLPHLEPNWSDLGGDSG